jgi:hypothetical protein
MIQNGFSFLVGLPLYMYVNQSLSNIVTQQEAEVNKMMSEVSLVSHLQRDQ